jgi:hypothetical protein
VRHASSSSGGICCWKRRMHIGLGLKIVPADTDRRLAVWRRRREKTHFVRKGICSVLKQENWVVIYPRLKGERRREKEEGERNYSSTRSCCHGVV